MISSLASTHFCPTLEGRFFCKKASASRQDMVMTISQEKNNDYIVYTYTYFEDGADPFEISFTASDQGVINPEHNMIGRCLDGYFFNSKDGNITSLTLFNTISSDGKYLVLYARDLSVHLECIPQ